METEMGIGDLAENTNLPSILLEKANNYIDWLDIELQHYVVEYDINLFGLQPKHVLYLLFAIGVVFFYSLTIFAFTNFIVKKRALKVCFYCLIFCFFFLYFFFTYFFLLLLFLFKFIYLLLIILYFNCFLFCISFRLFFSFYFTLII